MKLHTKQQLALPVLAALAVALAGPDLAQAQTAPPPSSVLPVVGIGAGQVLRVGIAALPSDGQRCMATLSFIDTRTGDLIGEVQPFDLGPGEADFFDLASDTVGVRRKQRADVQPMLAPSADSGPCQISYGVLDGSRGVLTALDSSTVPFGVLPPEVCAFSVLGPPILSAVSLGRGQTLQYTVVRKTAPFDINFDPRPCDITVNIFQDGVGIVASLITGPLSPGQMATVSVNGDSLGLNMGETAFLRDEVLFTNVPVQHPCGLICLHATHEGCVRSIQVIETKFALTTEVVLQCEQ